MSPLILTRVPKALTGADNAPVLLCHVAFGKHRTALLPAWLAVAEVYRKYADSSVYRLRTSLAAYRSASCARHSLAFGRMTQPWTL